MSTLESEAFGKLAFVNDAFRKSFLNVIHKEHR